MQLDLGITSRKQFTHEVTNGGMLALSELLVAVACASMIYTGVLERFLPVGAVLMLIGAGVSSIIIALGAGFRILQGGLHPAPCAVMGAGAAGIAGSAAIAGADPTIQFTTVFLYIFAGTFAFGVLLWLVRRFQLNRVSEFIPYPVIAGFLASVGWLFITAVFETAAGERLSLDSLALFVAPNTLAKLAVIVLVFFALDRLPRYFTSALTMPLTFFAAIALFYVIVLASGFSIAELQAEGWILGPYDTGGPFQAISLLSFPAANFGLLFGAIPDLVITLLVSTIATLLFFSAIEIGTRSELDTGRELQSISRANLATAFLACSPSTPYVPNTIMLNAQGMTSRVPALVSGTLFLGVGLLAGPLLNYLPTFALGSILLLFGISFLKEWVVRLYSRVELAEYLIALSIFAASIWLGIVEGVTVGVVICVIFFAVKYSTLSLVRSSEEGAAPRSDVERPNEELRLLQAAGDRTLTVELEGYLFFGTASRLYAMIAERVRAEGATIKYVVIDMRMVSGADSSALNNFVKLKLLAEREGLLLIFTEVKGFLRTQFERAGVIEDESDILRVMDETDLALEWIEDRILEEVQPGHSPVADIADLLRDLLGKESLVQELTPKLERLRLAAGQTLFEIGDEDFDIFFVESGSLSLFVPRGEGRELRLRKFGPGAIIGVSDYYDHDPRDAAARAESEAVLFRLPWRRLRDLNESHPRLAVALHEAMGTQMAIRLNSISEEFRKAMS